MTVEAICNQLNLEPNATCGSVRMSFVSKQSIAAGGLPAPFADGQPLGSALYFLVTHGAPVRLHRIRSDQLYHYDLGDPLEVFAARRRKQRARDRRTQSAERPRRPTPDPRQHVSHRA